MEIDRKKQPGVTFQVTFSMYEVYNEQVRDLLNKKNSPPGGLVVKESPTKGFFGTVQVFILH
jgi:kinesin family protein 1